MQNPRKVRICHVQVLPLMSGTQRSMLELFRHLDRDEFEIHVACKEAGPLTKELDRLNVSWHEVPALNRPIHAVRDSQAYRQLRELFRREKFDLVHTHSSKPGFLGRVAARRAGVPCVIHHVRGFSFHEFTPGHVRWFYKRLEKFAARYCDRVIFVNQEEFRLARDERLVAEAQATTVYNGANLQSLQPPDSSEKVAMRRELCQVIDPETVVILFSGRLEAQKQPLILADIVAALRNRVTRRPWRLVVAGDGPLEPALKTRLRELCVTDCVHFLGWQSNIRRIYGAADIVLLPSLFEGLSRSLIEAHSMGVPCVVSNVKGNREVVTDDTGFRCTPTNAASYASALAMLIDSPVLRTQMGYAARKRAEEYFDTVKNNRQIVAIYNELLAEKGIRPRRADGSAFTGWQRQAA